jgi:hypothetical protein
MTRSAGARHYFRLSSVEGAASGGQMRNRYSRIAYRRDVSGGTMRSV